MENFGFEHITLITGALIMLIGLWGLLTQKNIIKMIVGFALFDTGIHVVMVSIGYVKEKTAPIIDEAVNKQNAVNEVVDPVPQVLVLTAIVIGLGITALMLAYAIKLHQQKKSLEINNFKDLRW